MSSTKFARPVGAHADVNELCYISALHQTCMPYVRSNGTVSALDVQRYLKSRYYLTVDADTILDIVAGLGGDAVSMGAGQAAAAAAQVHVLPSSVEKQAKDRNEQNELLAGVYLDLVQLQTIILMPTIARAAAQELGQPGASRQPHDNDDIDNKYNDEFSQYNFWDWRKKKDDDTTDNNEARRYILRPQPNKMLEYVLHMLIAPLREEELHTGHNRYPKDAKGNYFLSPNLIAALLRHHGEEERANDSKLITVMFQHAMSKSTRGVLDTATWIDVLSSDLSAWKVGVEDEETTEMFDVFGMESYHDMKNAKLICRQDNNGNDDGTSDGVVSSDDVEQESAQELSPARIVEDTADLETGIEASGKSEKLGDSNEPKIQRVKAASYIDFAVDNQRSRPYGVFSWVFFLATVLTYTSIIGSHPSLEFTCRGTFGCDILHKVWVWLALALLLTVTGLVMLAPLSLGNLGSGGQWSLCLVSMFLTVVWIVSPYMLYWVIDNDNDPDQFEHAKKFTSTYFFEADAILCLASGIILFFCQAIQLVANSMNPKDIQQSRFSYWLTSTHVRGSARIKRAASRKINRMLASAFRLHPFNGRPVRELLSSGEGHRRLSMLRQQSVKLQGEPAQVGDNDKYSLERETMLNFVLNQNKFEPCGGILWTLTRMWNTALFADEGGWINNRIVTIQVAQSMVIISLGFFLFAGIQYVAEEAARANEEIQKYDDLPQWVIDFVPTEEQVYSALVPSATISMVVSFWIFSLYIPSTVSTTIKLRSGVLPSLYDPLWVKYRLNPDLVSMNVGNAVYSLFGAAMLFFAICALFLFLCIWPFSRPLMRTLGAWCIGLVITILIKVLLLKLHRAVIYRGLCRTRPYTANYSSLMLECWNIGIGGGAMIARLIQFILAAAFFLGRIDVPFLSTDVRLGGYYFDTAPTSFRKDILIHELHRHPYMQRLGTMYLMRLKHGKHFGSQAGACWRNLFVVALMPWLKKYRIFTEQRLGDSVADKMWLDREEGNAESDYRLTDLDRDEGNAESDIRLADLGEKLANVGEMAGKAAIAIQHEARTGLVTAKTLMVDEFPEAEYPHLDKDDE